MVYPIIHAAKYYMNTETKSILSLGRPPMDPTEQISIRHSEPCRPPSSHHRVHSTPVAISRHHSMPSFGTYLVYHMVEYSVPCLCCTQIRFYSVVTLFL